MSKRSKADSGRDAGGFVALPWSVLDSPAFKALSHTARSLLLEIARQFVRDNNGRLLASRAYLKKRGWASAGVIDRAKHELIDAGLIFETVKGHRPNKASWYAVTWRTLDKHPDYDPGALAGFERGAYRTLELAPMRPTREQCFERWRKVPGENENAVPSPSDGTERAGIGPPGGTAQALPVPSAGTIEASSRGAPVPAKRHHLEMPSADAQAARQEEQPSPDTAETVRVREMDLDPALFDPSTGEHLQAVPKANRPARTAAEAWVAASLRQQAASAIKAKTKTRTMSRSPQP